MKTKKKVSQHTKMFTLFSAEDITIVQRARHVVVGMSVTSAARASILSSRAHAFGAVLARGWRTWKGSGEVRAVFSTMDEAMSFTKSCKKAATSRKKKKVVNE